MVKTGWNNKQKPSKNRKLSEWIKFKPYFDIFRNGTGILRFTSFPQQSASTNLLITSGSWLKNKGFFIDELEIIGYIINMNAIDLHGLSVAEARTKLETGLKSALASGEWVVRIIHGQGKHSEVFPVIKSMVRRWLDESDFAIHIESVFRGEDGSPYTVANPGETIVVLKNGGTPPAERELEYDPEEEWEARRNTKAIRADRLRKLRRRTPRR